MLADIVVDFDGALPGMGVISDFAFVSDDNRNILVLGASTDNEVALVDLNDNFRLVKLGLTTAAESTGGRSRHIEWAVGTNYVWVTGGDANQLYVIEIPSAKKSTVRNSPRRSTASRPVTLCL